MAVVANETWIGVAASNVIRGDVVTIVATWCNPPRQVRQRYIWIASDPAIWQNSKVPVVTAGDVAILERSGRRDREQVPDPGALIDRKGRALATFGHLERPPTSYVGLPPGLARKQDPDASVGVDPDQGDMTTLLGSEIRLDAISALVRLVTVRPHGDPPGSLLAPGRLIGLEQCGWGSVQRAGEQAQNDEHKPPQVSVAQSARAMPLWLVFLRRGL
jgi:hypothetical protein